MESLVQTLLDSQPTSNISKATQTDAPEITTGYKSEATQTDAVQSPKVYGSKATQTDKSSVPTPNEDCKKVENPPVQPPMSQQSPRGSRTDQTDFTWPVPTQLVSESIQGFPKFEQDFNIVNGSVSVKSTIDEAMERYNLVSR